MTAITTPALMNASSKFLASGGAAGLGCSRSGRSSANGFQPRLLFMAMNVSAMTPVAGGARGERGGGYCPFQDGGVPKARTAVRKTSDIAITPARSNCSKVIPASSRAAARPRRSRGMVATGIQLRDRVMFMTTLYVRGYYAGGTNRAIRELRRHSVGEIPSPAHGRRAGGVQRRARCSQPSRKGRLAARHGFEP